MSARKAARLRRSITVVDRAKADSDGVDLDALDFKELRAWLEKVREKDREAAARERRKEKLKDEQRVSQQRRELVSKAKDIQAGASRRQALEAVGAAAIQSFWATAEPLVSGGGLGSEGRISQRALDATNQAKEAWLAAVVLALATGADWPDIDQAAGSALAAEARRRRVRFEWPPLVAMPRGRLR